MRKITLPARNQIASMDVDAQNTFTPICPKELPVPEGHCIVNELNRQAEFAQFRIGSKDAHSLKAIWVSDETHAPLSELTAENVDCYWPAHAIIGTKGFELIAGLPKPTDYDFFVWKGIELDLHPYGACYHDLAEKLSTGLIEYLMLNNITTVLVGGLALDFCVKTTALQLRRNNFNVLVNLAATKAIAKDSCESALKEMQQKGIELFNSVDDLISTDEAK